MMEDCLDIIHNQTGHSGAAIHSQYVKLSAWPDDGKIDLASDRFAHDQWRPRIVLIGQGEVTGVR
jgi:hypothetical protein